MKKAILVALDYKDEDDFAMSLSELKGLCKACDIEYTKVIIQSITPTKPYYMGKGKVNEVKRMIDDEEMVIVGEELTPLQVRNLTEELGLEVTDRTDLILRIFASRAKTKEAKLQVEIARLNYELPRLAGMHEGIYSQQGGSGFRGAGETQLEIDRRRILIGQTQQDLHIRMPVKLPVNLHIHSPGDIDLLPILKNQRLIISRNRHRTPPSGKINTYLLLHKCLSLVQASLAP